MKNKKRSRIIMIIIAFFASWLAFVLLPYSGLNSLMNAFLATVILISDLILGKTLGRLNK